MAGCETYHVTVERIFLIQFFALILSQSPHSRKPDSLIIWFGALNPFAK
jgi:hypothetical protein